MKTNELKPKASVQPPLRNHMTQARMGIQSRSGQPSGPTFANGVQQPLVTQQTNYGVTVVDHFVPQN